MNLIYSFFLTLLTSTDKEDKVPKHVKESVPFFPRIKLGGASNEAVLTSAEKGGGGGGDLRVITYFKDLFLETNQPNLEKFMTSRF